MMMMKVMRMMMGVKMRMIRVWLPHQIRLRSG
jgi:hypothetical protein